ncbi:RNA 3'-terminal phosphate cyclase [Psychrobacter sp. I-STPA6b]|uniref:RNA 3'-terminal phosphate cyclase n=1 Tax=Psychrobacter sp. I-STPA6b TaxID=2585718 RepID=UPI001D0CC972|nr:RNA 3'-terminal phosphate cyclase [Psychrobacter sp. I-STPA6b]
MDFYKIDGAYGEGGGQIIRSALSLSMITGTAIHIQNIRAKRKKSGLMRQHLVCVQASQRISNAQVTGAELGSTEIKFAPQTVCAGEYQFDIGSAGSTSLVLQTLLPALLFADTEQPSNVTIQGGTHNPLAPTADFLIHGFLPILTKLGMQIDYELIQAGFTPIGGGKVRATIHPFMRRTSDKPFCLFERGELQTIKLVADCLNLDTEIAKRELNSCQSSLASLVDESLLNKKTRKLRGIGEGNCCFALVQSSQHQEVFTVLGEKRMSAEKVGNRLAGLIRRYLCASDSCVDEYLCDQLLLPLALAGGGEFSARFISQHSYTQAWLIEQFLDVRIHFKDIAKDKVHVQVLC